MTKNNHNNDGQKIYLTAGGIEKITRELEELKTSRRPKAVERLALARGQGDLSENNEYASAKEELSFIDDRIDELEKLVKNICLIDEKKKSDCVCLGCKVTVSSDKNENVYHIVGEWEADPGQKKVSNSSPLGKALIGKRIGEEAEFEAPAGKIIFKVLNIE